MAFKGYFIQVGSWKIPLSYMAINTITNNPYKVMDSDPYYDGNGLLHRNPVSHTSADLKFSTPVMTMSEKETFMSKLRAQLTDKKRRDCKVTFYNDETGEYETGDFYLAEPTFSPSTNSVSGEILYNSIELEFIKY